ncbi:MAG: hypothetical protein EOO28_28595 [Comamonadaceae bacterium]|nr:MAG: hypothetical protein EOO28_28595 [Comamonadaceae bacterium]
MIKTSLIAASLAVASLGAAVSTQANAQTTRIYVQTAPPPLRAEVAPPPRRGQVWVPGHWDWRGRQYVWVSGNFVRARPGYYYSEPVWVQRGDRWERRGGAWNRGDRDRDGVPNGRDRDRDGDGVPNRFDNNPNNPNRR